MVPAIEHLSQPQWLRRVTRHTRRNERVVWSSACRKLRVVPGRICRAEEAIEEVSMVSLKIRLSMPKAILLVIRIASVRPHRTI